jgi:hypothetical protein
MASAQGDFRNFLSDPLEYYVSVAVNQMRNIARYVEIQMKNTPVIHVSWVALSHHHPLRGTPAVVLRYVEHHFLLN